MDWISVKDRLPKEYQEVDVWLVVPPSLRSFGMGDAWRVADAWREGDKWFDRTKGEKAELYKPYITHWMPQPKPPKGSTQAHDRG